MKQTEIEWICPKSNCVKLEVRKSLYSRRLREEEKLDSETNSILLVNVLQLPLLAAKFPFYIQ